MSDILEILSALDTADKSVAITRDQHKVMVTYGTPHKPTVGRIVAHLRNRRVIGLTTDTVTDYAAQTGMARQSLTHWSSAVIMLTDTDTAVTDATFTDALTVYNGRADWTKANRPALLKAVKAADQRKRAGLWADAAKAVKADRRADTAAKRTPTTGSDTVTTTDTDTAATDTAATTTTTSATTTDTVTGTPVVTRAPRMADHTDVGEYTAAWLVTFRQVVAAAGQGDETFIVPDAGQAREIDALIVALRSHLTADAPVLA